MYDPAPRNMAYGALNAQENKFVTMAMIDLTGKKRGLPSAKRCGELIASTIHQQPVLRHRNEIVVVERQTHKNNKNVKIQKSLEKTYEDLGIEVIILDPKKVFAYVRTRSVVFPECKRLIKEHGAIQGKTEADAQKRYTVKKKLYCAFGKRLVRRGSERLMMTQIAKKRKELEKGMRAHDVKSPPKKPRQTKRSVKKRPDDLYDVVVGVLYQANQLAKEGKFGLEPKRDFFEERLSL